jgi:hypothetical protein
MVAGVQFYRGGAYPTDGYARYYVGPEKDSISGKHRAYGAIIIGKSTYNVNGPWQK